MNEKVSLLKKIWINLHNENPWKTSKWKKGERVPLTKAAVPPLGFQGILWMTYYTQLLEIVCTKSTAINFYKNRNENEQLNKAKADRRMPCPPNDLYLQTTIP